MPALPALPSRPHRSDLIAAVILAATLLWAALAGRRLWFFSDDWNIIAQFPSGDLLEPFNSHLSLVPIGIYQLLFHTVGLESYLPYRIVGLAAYAVLGLMVWRYASRNLGAVAGAAALTLVLWNAAGVTNVMFPFLMNFSIPVAALAAAWWHLDRTSLRGEVAASVWLGVALATSGLGLMVAAALGAELLWSRAPVRRWLILAPGPVLWLIWYLAAGTSSPSSGGLRAVAIYAARMLIAGGNGLTGTAGVGGWLVCAALGALLATCLGFGVLNGRIVGAFVAPIVFAVLTAWSRLGVVPAIAPDELRYRWTIGAFWVLAAASMLHALHDHPRWEPIRERVQVRVAAVVLVAGGAIAGAAVLVTTDVPEWVDTVEASVIGVRANLWVAEQAGRDGTVERSRALPVSYVRVEAGEYLDAVAELGSPLVGFEADAFSGSAESIVAANEAFIAQFDLGLDPVKVDPVKVESGDVNDGGATDGDEPVNWPPRGCRPSAVLIDGTHGATVSVPFGATARVDADDAAVVALDLFSDGDRAAVIPRRSPGGDHDVVVKIPSLTRPEPIADATISVDGHAAVTICVP
ncbi:MAG: hypothetical protein R2689_03060 [Microthrixaceae bacterium]